MNIEELLEHYHCPKCRCRKPVASERVIPKAGKVPLPLLNRFLFVSCSLCGYTEIYNLKILEKAGNEAEEFERNEAPQEHVSPS